MFVRFSSKNLKSFWPVILTELVRIFSESPLDENLVFSACKFIDVGLVVAPEEFQLFEWMFIANTQAPLKSTFVPMLQQIVIAKMSKNNGASLLKMEEEVVKGMKRPLIPVRNLSEVGGTEPFQTFSEHYLSKWPKHIEQMMLQDHIDEEYLAQILDSEFLEIEEVVKNTK
jgi:hypothetical protein